MDDAGRRLDTWKDIAAYLGRRVRTTQRWEKEEGLPVHRQAHRRRGTIFAWTAELDAWRATRAVPPAAAVRAIAPAAAFSERRRPPNPALAAVLLTALGAGGLLALWPSAPPPPDQAELPQRLLTARYLLHRGAAAEVERALAICAEPPRPEDDGATRAALHECRAQGILERPRRGGDEPRGVTLARARREAEAALALDPDRPEALVLAARARFGLDWDAAAAEAAYRRALALDPRSATAHHALAGLLSLGGRHDEAIAELRLAQRAAPLSAAINDDGCWYFYRARRPREAIVEAERALTLEPGRPGALECLVDAHTDLGRHEAARDAAVAWLRALGDPTADRLAASPAPAARDLLRRRQLARLEELGRSAPSAGAFAMTYGQLGERGEALRALERAVAEHDPVLLLVRVHPAFDSLRGDPALEPLLRRAGV